MNTTTESRPQVSRLRASRLLSGLSLDDVVKRVRAAGGKTDRGELSRFERDLREMTEEKAVQFAAALGVPVSEIQPEAAEPTLAEASRA